MKIGVAGSKESSDCLVTVKESDIDEIIIDSVVGAFFHVQINKVIIDTLEEYKVKHVSVTCIDRGALDSTIKARLITAIERMNGDD
ncbi:MAG: citrate lyase acyl carrier protein [Candidatus Izemoplasmatales bacterium]|nr:citrate lyase acyl carrier protein [Candidatus Izemoplasmatales bacterium]MDD3123791.1 citrate lyase acyl carrier protein [Candidatus Izemoplasmatales bacterium]